VISAHDLSVMELKVECYAGYKGEETPRRFYLAHHCVEVVDVIDRWLAPDHCYFKVKGSNGGIYLLRHDIAHWTWELTVYRATEAL
jgi:hypothetical protein